MSENPSINIARILQDLIIIILNITEWWSYASLDKFKNRVQNEFLKPANKYG
jgi:hypothetical protein